MFKAGQKLWFVHTEKRSGNPYEVTVEKAGRIWATLDNHLRCDASGMVDGGKYQSPGHCYQSREVYELKKAREKAWLKFKLNLERKKMPDALTLEALAEISSKLGIIEI